MTWPLLFLSVVAQELDLAAGVKIAGRIWWTGFFGWLVYVCVCWLAWRHRGLLIWLAWTTVPLFAFIMGFVLLSPAPADVMNLWMWSLPTFPVYWIYREVRFGPSRIGLRVEIVSRTQQE